MSRNKIITSKTGAVLPVTTTNVQLGDIIKCENNVIELSVKSFQLRESFPRPWAVFRQKFMEETQGRLSDSVRGCLLLLRGDGQAWPTTCAVTCVVTCVALMVFIL